MTLVYYVYAIFLAVGGIFGFVKAQSMPSLIAGIASAVLVIVAALLMPHHPRVALGLGIIVTLALSAFFLMRFQKTRKPMPSLPLLVLSDLVLIASVLRLLGVVKF